MFTQQKPSSKLLSTLSIALILLGVIGVIQFISGGRVMDQDQQTQTQEVEQAAAGVEPVVYEVEEDGQNAFELLNSTAEIEYKEYDFGVFVESINGIPSDDQYFWALYVNDAQATTGADQTILQSGDRVEWRYEEIQ